MSSLVTSKRVHLTETVGRPSTGTDMVTEPLTMNRLLVLTLIWCLGVMAAGYLLMTMIPEPGSNTPMRTRPPVVMPGTPAAGYPWTELRRV